MYKKIQELIKQYNTIILVSHIYPDGDAFGSQIGLKEAIKTNYPDKNVYVVGSGLKDFYDLLGPVDEVSDDVFNDALAILLDSNDLNRFEDQRFRLANKTIVIDHHVKGDREIHADVVLSIETASATCEIVLDLCRKLKLQFSNKCANALFLGILTDTGRFQYVNDYKKIFDDASFLIEKGANPTSIYKILNVVKEKDLFVRSIVFSKLKRYKEGLLVSYLKYKDIKKLGLSSTQVANYVNLLANIENYPIWVVACQNKEGHVKFEFRSNKYPLQPIAAKYGGGGHTYACGLTIENCTIQQFNAVIADILMLLGEN